MHRTIVSTLILAAGLAMPAMAQTVAPAKPVPTKEAPAKQVPTKELPAKQIPTKPQPAAPTKPVAPGSNEAVKQQLSPVAKPGTPANPVPASEGGVLTFEKMEHDFGVISDDKVMDTEYKFKNTGTGALTIVSTQGSCGCTVPALEKKIYAPGEEGSIKVQYNPNHKRGAQHTTITVTANDSTKANNQVVLAMKTEVRPIVAVEPASLALGQAVKGQGKKMMITVTSRQKDIAVISATPTVAMLDAKVLPVVETQINGEQVWQYPVEVTLAPTAQVGMVSGSVAVRTSDPARVANFIVQGEVIGDVTANPQRVQLLGLAPGQDFAQTITLKSRVNKPFRVLKIHEQSTAGPTGVFSVLDVQPDTSTNPPSYTLSIGGKAPTQGGMVSGFLVVTTDIADEKEFKIPYSGYVRVNTPPKPQPVTKPAGAWEANPSSLIPQ